MIAVGSDYSNLASVNARRLSFDDSTINHMSSYTYTLLKAFITNRKEISSGWFCNWGVKLLGFNQIWFKV